jgi:hypothetical protein
MPALHFGAVLVLVRALVPVLAVPVVVMLVVVVAVVAAAPLVIIMVVVMMMMMMMMVVVMVVMTGRPPLGLRHRHVSIHHSVRRVVPHRPQPP